MRDSASYDTALSCRGTTPSTLDDAFPAVLGDPYANPPTSIGPYAILELLGSGGMGDVWLGQQFEPIQRRAAIKLVERGVAPDLIQRFNEEQRVLAALEHPGIARLFEIGTTEDGRPWFAMEVVAGEPIDAFCRARTLAQRLQIFRRVCRAVQHAHARGVVHRDLKPSKILVAEIDGEALPKVIDFGIAKALDRGASGNPLQTMAGGFLGTPAYASPEQAGGAEVDARADVYSLGAILYQLLADTPPFDPQELAKMTTFELQRTIAQVTPVQPSARATNGFELGSLDAIVMRALEKDRDRRDIDAGALGDAIDAKLETLIGRGLGSAGGSARTSPSPRARIVLFAVSALILLGAWLALRETKFKTSPRGDEGAKGKAEKKDASPPLRPLAPEPRHFALALHVTGSTLCFDWTGPEGSATLHTAACAGSEAPPRTLPALRTLADTQSRPAQIVTGTHARGEGWRLRIPLADVADVVALSLRMDDGSEVASRVLRVPSLRARAAPRWKRAGDALELGLTKLCLPPIVTHCDRLGYEDLVVFDRDDAGHARMRAFTAREAGVFELRIARELFARGEFPHSARTAHHDHDDAPDLFVGTNTGIRSFASVIHSPPSPGRTYSCRPNNETWGAPTTAIDSGDFNGDGVLDIASLEEGAQGPSAVVRFGGFDPESYARSWNWRAKKTEVQGIESRADGPKSLRLVDLNADGFAELLVAQKSSDGGTEIHVVRGNPARTTRARLAWSGDAGIDLATCAIFDVTGDGKLDILAVDNGEAVLLEAQDSKTFSSAKPSRLTAGPHDAATLSGILLGDLDADGVEDLVLCRRGEDSTCEVVVAIGAREEASRRWRVRREVDVERRRCAEPPDVALAQLDTNGTLDLVVTWTADDGTARVTSWLGEPARSPKRAFDFAGEQRAFDLTALAAQSQALGRPGSSVHLLPSTDGEIRYLESADKDRLARLARVAPAPPSLTIENAVENAAMAAARIVDRNGADVVSWNEDGLSARFPSRGRRPIDPMRSVLTRLTPDHVWSAQLSPAREATDWIFALEGRRASSFAWRDGEFVRGPKFQMDDVPDRCVIADFDANGMDDCLAMRFIGADETNIELWFCAASADGFGRDFVDVPDDRVIPGRVSSVVAAPVAARSGYNDLHKTGLFVGREDGSYAAMFFGWPKPRGMPNRYLAKASERSFKAVFPAKALLLHAADFDRDGLHDLVFAARDGSEIHIGYQDVDTRAAKGSAVGLGVFHERTELAMPWRADAGWRIERILSLHLDRDATLDLAVLARHEASGQHSLAMWYARID